MDSTRERLIAAAEDLVGERGASALALREVARRAGVSPMAVYRHFDGLDALRFALRDRGYERLTRAMTEGLAAPDAAGRLYAVGRQYVAFALAWPAHYELMFTGGLPPEEAARHVEHRQNATSFRFVVDRVREAMEAGAMPKGDPEQRAIQVWALLHGLVSLQREGKLRLEPAAFDAVVASALIWVGGRAP